MRKFSKLEMAKRIKEARIRRFKGTVTQKQMAALLRIPYKTYQNWEIGKAAPKRDFITFLANVLRVDPEELEFGPKSRGKEITMNLIQTYFPKKPR